MGYPWRNLVSKRDETMGLDELVARYPFIGASIGDNPDLRIVIELLSNFLLLIKSA